METIYEKAERESNDLEAIEEAKRQFDEPLWMKLPYGVRVALFPILILPVIFLYLFTFRKQLNKTIWKA
jgi:hypothetical protein